MHYALTILVLNMPDLVQLTSLEVQVTMENITIVDNLVDTGSMDVPVIWKQFIRLGSITITGDGGSVLILEALGNCFNSCRTVDN